MREEGKKRLIDAGVQMDEVLERFMGNEQLLERMLKKFSHDTTFLKLREAAEEKDGDRALALSHTLKGMCSNLSMTELTSLFTCQVELFRAGNVEEAFELMEEIVQAYERMLAGIGEIE